MILFMTCKRWLDGSICADLYFRGTMEEFETAFLTDLREQLNITDIQDDGMAGSGDGFVYITAEYPNYYTYANQECQQAPKGSPVETICTANPGYPSANGWDDSAQVGQGGFETQMSWMLPADLYHPDNKERAKELFRQPVMMAAAGHVLGGAVLNNISAQSTAVNPATRAAGQEMILPPGMA